MNTVSDWLHAMLKSHVVPDDKVTKQHGSLVELRMRQMEELLPKVNKVFEGVKVEMAGSVQSRSKVSNNTNLICSANFWPEKLNTTEKMAKLSEFTFTKWVCTISSIFPVRTMLMALEISKNFCQKSRLSLSKLGLLDTAKKTRDI
jgi:hypothetical protein